VHQLAQSIARIVTWKTSIPVLAFRQVYHGTAGAIPFTSFSYNGEIEKKEIK
jgi:hypothetical protein